METKKTAAKAEPKGIHAADQAGLIKLAERMREIEACAKHAADPREPAEQIAAAIADHIEGK